MSLPDKHEAKNLKKLIFFGSPLLDITTTCGRDLLEKYSLKPDGCIPATGHQDGLFEELFRNPESRLDAGGSALNSAKIAKWVLGDTGKIAFAGCVGKDEYASKLCEDLNSRNVEPLFITSLDNSTGVCACLLNSDGLRSMCTRQGAAASFSKNHLEESNIRKWLNEADCIFVVGYFLLHSPEVVFELADRCLPSQLFSLSLSSEYICINFTNNILQILPKVDIVLGNEEEIIAFATAASAEEYLTSEAAASAIAKLPKIRGPQSRIVIVTRGPNPVILVRGEEPPQQYPVPQGVPVLDSVGCGDALAGAFLAIYTLTGRAERAIETGIRSAVEIAQVPGCNPPLYSLVDEQADSSNEAADNLPKKSCSEE